MKELQKALRGNIRKRTDETALVKLQKDYGNLLKKEAMILAETDDAMMRMTVSPSQYHDLEPMLDEYRKLLMDWHGIKGNVKIGRDKAYQMERIAKNATVKSGHKLDQVRQLYSQVEALEVKQRLKSGEVAAFRNKIRDAKYASTDKRRKAKTRR